MKCNIEIDEDLAAEVQRTASLIRERPATVLRLAIKNGLPLVAKEPAVARPAGYFAEAYEDGTRAELEDRLAKSLAQIPER